MVVPPPGHIPAAIVIQLTAALLEMAPLAPDMVMGELMGLVL